MVMEKTSPKDTTSQLQDAIRKLEAFAQQEAKEQSRSPVSKTIGLMLKLLQFDSSKKGKNEHNPDEKEVREAVELINRRRLLIQQLETGSPAERKLADSFTSAIGVYNQIRSGSGKLPKIGLPQQHTVEYHFPESSPKPVLKRTISAVQQKAPTSSVTLSKQSADLFYMKTISLLERYGIATNPEARTIVRQSPIITAVDGDQDRCTLTQTLTLFPGQTVVIIGTSVLDPKTHTIHKLFPETFSLSLESTQTGYPYPSQRTGWALASQILHDYPQRTDLLGKIADLLQRKKDAANELLQQGPLLDKAKRLFKFKSQVFSAHQSEFLSLHKQLAHAIITAAPQHFITPHTHIAVNTYFDAMHNQQNPFHWLVDTNQTLSNLFITKPHQTLLNAILKGKTNDIGSNDPAIRFLAAKATLDQALQDTIVDLEIQLKNAQNANERIKLDYILHMGVLLGTSSKSVILQYLSEDLMFAPPPLSRFEQKIQSAAYRHVQDFLEELILPLNGTIEQIQQEVYRLLKAEIKWDIALFQQDGLLPISTELAQYFETRYQSLSAE